MEMPWSAPGGRNGVLPSLPEAEGQRVVADGIFASAPWAGLCPFPVGEQQPRAGREVILSGKQGQFPPFGVGRVKNKGQVPKSDRMLKSPSSPHTSSFIPLPSIPFPPLLLCSAGFSLPEDLPQAANLEAAPSPQIRRDLARTFHPSPFPPPPSAQTFPSPFPSLLLPWRGVPWK